MRRLLRNLRIFHGALLRASGHDWLNLAQSTAYSAMVALFPALIVAAAVISFLPDNTPIRTQLAILFDRVLPADVSPLLQGYFVDEPHSTHSTHAFMVALVLGIIGASSVIATLMEGVRRANELPVNCWTFLQRRLRALLLVPLSLVPFTIASILVVFGHFFTQWLATHIVPSAQTPIFLIALLLRWSIALAGSVGIIGLIYHMGTPMEQSWKRVLPGAILATIAWFLTTLGFGWYVTRFANYSQVYGSLGAAIALLFWLYIISLCVLYGAEFNVEFHSRASRARSTQSKPPTPNTLPPV